MFFALGALFGLLVGYPLAYTQGREEGKQDGVEIGSMLEQLDTIIADFDKEHPDLIDPPMVCETLTDFDNCLVRVCRSTTMTVEDDGTWHPTPLVKNMFVYKPCAPKNKYRHNARLWPPP